MGPFDRYRRRIHSARPLYGFVTTDAGSHRYTSSGYYLTSEQVLELAWKVAGATMAAAGVSRGEVASVGDLVEPTIRRLVREYGITVPEHYRR